MVNEFFNKGAKKIEWKTNSLLRKWYQDNRISTYKRMNLNLFLTLYTIIYSK